MKPSPWPAPPVYIATSVPVKSLRVMMFTTPPIASEPYTADAPSLRTSTRSIMASGIALRSTEVLAPEPPATTRRPLSSVSVRLAPRPRMLIRVEPSPPLLACALIALDCSGSCCRMSPTVARPAALSSSRLSTVSGAAVVSVLRSIVEPVTVMISSLADCSESLASSSSVRSGLCRAVSDASGAGGAAAAGGGSAAGAAGSATGAAGSATGGAGSAEAGSAGGGAVGGESAGGAALLGASALGGVGSAGAAGGSCATCATRLAHRIGDQRAGWAACGRIRSDAGAGESA